MSFKLNFLLTGVLILLGRASYGASEDFATPPCLRANTDFWRKILTEYGRNQIVIHDSATFEIYKVIELKDAKAEASRSKLIKEAIEHLDEELDDNVQSLRAQTGVKEKFEAGLGRSKAHLPTIKKIFKEINIPEEISYLPHVESSFQANARSRVGARGMWQIMPGTARMYGVRNLKKLHEPTYSTRVAGKILLDNYMRLGNWNLAINAYHSGLGNLMRGKAQAGSKDICKIMEEYRGRSFRFASRNYLGQFYAVLEILGKIDSESLASDGDLEESRPEKSIKPKKDRLTESKPKVKKDPKIKKPKDKKALKEKGNKKKVKEKQKPKKNKPKEPKTEKKTNVAPAKEPKMTIDRIPNTKTSKGSFDDFN